MEKQYSVQFFTSLVEAIQGIVQESLGFDQFVEVSGYINVEIDNTKKERYVLSELLQSSGSVISESFCVKSFETPEVAPASSRRNRLKHQHVRKRPCPVKVAASPQYNSDRMNSQNTESYPTKPTNTSTLSKTDQFNIPNDNSNMESLIGVSVPEYIEYDEEKDSVKEIKCYVPNVFASTDFPTNQTVKSEKKKFASRLLQQSDTYEDPQGTSSQAVIPTERSAYVQLPEEEDDFIDEGDAMCDMYAEGYSSVEDSNHSMLVSVNSGASVRVTSGASEGIATFSPATRSLIRRSVKQFQIFLFRKYEEDIDLMSCPPKRLESLIMEYFMEAKKKGGGDFRAKSLKCMMQRLDMFLRDVGYPYSLFKGDKFKTLRDYIKRKMGNECASIPVEHVLVSDDDIEVMFEKNQLGLHSLEVLTNTMWILNSLYLRVKSPNQHCCLKWGDIVLKTDGGQEYLERYINPTFSFKFPAKPGNLCRCFVNFYKKFRALRPPLALDNGHAFYLKHSKSDIGGGHLYILEPVSYYVLGALWRKLLTNAGLPFNKKIF